MTSNNNSTQSDAWRGLVGAYEQARLTYQAAFDAVPGDLTDEQAAPLHEEMKRWYDTVLAFPVNSTDELAEKAAILDEEYWDADQSLRALGDDARRLLRRPA